MRYQLIKEKFFASKINKGLSTFSSIKLKDSKIFENIKYFQIKRHHLFIRFGY